VCGLSPAKAQESRKFKVLVVFSYEETHQNTIRCKEGIEPVLGNSCEIRYFYMNTKMNFDSGPEKAKQAYAVYQEFQPDGVIVTEDDAQSMFVLPYLKDKVKTPVMFCAVNAEPEKYGYPASHISGISERLHIRESVTLAQQLIPSVKTVGFMMKESPVAELIASHTDSLSNVVFSPFVIRNVNSNFHHLTANWYQIGKETNTYSALSAGIKYPKTLREAVAMADELKNSCDILYITALPGLLGEDGKPLEEKEMYHTIVNAFGKPVIGDTEYQVRLGALCSVVQQMKEQGETAAQMLLKAMQGTPVAQIPIARNKQGKSFVNVTMLKALGISPKPEILSNIEFVRTEK
jgi:ABC-type uncharacterized transport system substrate-binding protein